MNSPQPRSWLAASSWAIGCLLAAAALTVVFVHTPRGQVVDSSAFALGAPVIAWLPVLNALRLWLVVGLAVGAISLSVPCLIRREFSRIGLALAVAMITVTSAWAIKGWLSRPFYSSYGYAWNTLPSGHVAAACSLVAVCLLLLPRARSQGWRIIGIVVIMGGCWLSLLSFAHRPSDALASVLLTSAVVAILSPIIRARIPALAHGVRWAALAAGIISMVGFLILMMTPVAPNLLLLVAVASAIAAASTIFGELV